VNNINKSLSGWRFTVKYTLTGGAFFPYVLLNMLLAVALVVLSVWFFKLNPNTENVFLTWMVLWLFLFLFGIVPFHRLVHFKCPDCGNLCQYDGHFLNHEVAGMSSVPIYKCKKCNKKLILNAEIEERVSEI